MPSRLAVLDSNVLVFAYLSDHKFHTAAQSLVGQAGGPAAKYVFAEQNLLEWYSVITSPRRIRHQLSPDAAGEVLRRIRVTVPTILRPNADSWDLFQSMLEQAPQVRGKDIFDRYLAATALSHGIDTILTDNTKDFASIPGLTAINPFLDGSTATR